MSIQRAQKEAGGRFGSNLHIGDCGPRLAPEHAARGRVHSRLAGNVGTPNCPAAVASRVIVYATVARPISELLSRLNHGIERSCRVGLPTCGSRRAAVVLSRLLQLVPNCRCLIARGNAIEPTRSHACSFQPTAETHLHQRLSCVRRLNDRDRDTKGLPRAGTAFWKAGNVFRA
jgi:hypothetical protein